MRSPLASYPDDAWAIVRGIFRLTRLLCLVIAIAAPVWAAEVAVHDLARSSMARRWAIRGVVTARAAKTSHRGNDYTTFKLTDGGDAVSVFGWGRLPVHNGDHRRRRRRRAPGRPPGSKTKAA